MQPIAYSRRMATTGLMWATVMDEENNEVKTPEDTLCPDGYYNTVWCDVYVQVMLSLCKILPDKGNKNTAWQFGFGGDEKGGLIDYAFTGKKMPKIPPIPFIIRGKVYTMIFKKEKETQ